MQKVETFNIEDLEKGTVHIKTHRTGKFEKVREIAAKYLKKKGEAMKYYDLTKIVQEELSLASPQEAYNYVRNALKPDKRFEIKKYGNKGEKPLSFVVRVL